MPNISKHKHKQAHLESLYKQLSKFLGNNRARRTDRILEELLGYEEKVMLAKRFAAIVMLAEQNSTYRTAQLLYMSQSTIEQLRKKLQRGEYDHMLQLLTRKKKEYQDFWETLEVVLRAGMPPRGRGRWKSVYTHLAR